MENTLPSVDRANGYGNVRSIPRSSLHRLTIHYEDDNVRERAQETLRRLLVRATRADREEADAGAVLAKNALQYRGVYHLLGGVDVTSPQFDPSKFLGVEWHKTSDLGHSDSRS